MRIPKPQEIYRHFKGKLYQIVTVAKHSETGELLVIYQALYGNFEVYARPLSLFTERVDKVKYPQETQEYRFELQKTEEMPEQPIPEKTEGRETEPDDGEGEVNLDPLIVEFLDAKTYEERLNILVALHHRITDDMINVMAMATDIEVQPGDMEKRYGELRDCLLKLEKYECNRLR